MKLVKLKGNSLVGTLPDSWSTLTNLAKLELDKNRLTSTLPASWSTLHKLSEVSVADNPGIQGELPMQWSTIADYTEFTINADYTYVSRGPSAARRAVPQSPGKPVA